MGGGGIKPGAPATPMAGKGLGAGPAMGAPPRPPMVKPPGMGAGAPPPMPGGAIAAGPPPPPAGGMGGSGGFAKGGSIGLGKDEGEREPKDRTAFKRGGSVVSGGDVKARVKSKTHK